MAERCMCNCFDCDVQPSNEDRVMCAAFMAVRIASDTKKQIDRLVVKISDKKEKTICNPLPVESVHDAGKPFKPGGGDGERVEPL